MNGEIVRILSERGIGILNNPYERIEFTGNKLADDILNDLENYPHVFVLACVMDKQVGAERAWLVPYRIGEEIEGFEFQRFLSLELDRIIDIFSRRNLHRFPSKMARESYDAVQRIHSVYKDNASNIWQNCPSSCQLVARFLEFNGIGPKVATMATNILVREFKVPLADRRCIDISTDVHVKRVFTRTGLIRVNASNEELVYRAREINPEYPGVFDLPAWELGRRVCRARNPNCNDCYLNAECPKVGVS